MAFRLYFVTSFLCTHIFCPHLGYIQFFAISTFVLPAHIIRVLKRRRIGLAGHVAHMGDREGVYMVLMSRPEETTI